MNTTRSSAKRTICRQAVQPALSSPSSVLVAFPRPVCHDGDNSGAFKSVTNSRVKVLSSPSKKIASVTILLLCSSYFCGIGVTASDIVEGGLGVSDSDGIQIDNQIVTKAKGE